MFKKLRQKIESESEGEQSPVSRNERQKKRPNEVRSTSFKYDYLQLFTILKLLQSHLLYEY